MLEAKLALIERKYDELIVQYENRESRPVSPRPTAAAPGGVAPCCSCKLTRVACRRTWSGSRSSSGG